MTPGDDHRHSAILNSGLTSMEVTRLTTCNNLVFLVVCSLPQAKFPVSSLNALYLVFPPRVRTSWIRLVESSLVMAG